ncbi:DUF2630 family protein [Streptacidiphilus sp. PAMC 29251]
MNDEDVLQHIRALVDEEHQLRSAPTGQGDGNRSRLNALEQQLDQYWDLLRRRRAATEFGTDPVADVRPVSEVEGYLG